MNKTHFISRLLRRFSNEFFLLIKYFIPSFIATFFRLNKKRIIFNSSFSSRYEFNGRYLFEYFLINHNEFEVFFIINNDKLRAELNLKYGDFFITSKRTRDIWFILKSKTWVLSTVDIPILSPFIHKERIVYHIGHGIPLKHIGLSEKNIPLLSKLNRIIRFRFFTDILCYSNDLEIMMSNALRVNDARMVPLGQPRNDALIKNKLDYLLEKTGIRDRGESKYILYAPTWRPYSNTKFFPFAGFSSQELSTFLEKNDIYIYLRPHPHYVFEVDKSILALDRVVMFDSEDFPEVMDFLSCFDLLITDYSSIYLDFIALTRPVIFIPYDLELYKREVGFSVDYDAFTPGHKVHDQTNLFYSIIESLQSFTYKEEVKKINAITNSKPDNNSKENAEYIINNVEM
ncbi:CDP-glycerol glycerophosphotransferase family protein [Vibrio parahaemolyticus]|nr:CDP-glycerol glycerophosphotransferase family protein [Vibrio parahaemolyticus]